MVDFIELFGKPNNTHDKLGVEALIEQHIATEKAGTRHHNKILRALKEQIIKKIPKVSMDASIYDDFFSAQKLHRQGNMEFSEWSRVVAHTNYQILKTYNKHPLHPIIQDLISAGKTEDALEKAKCGIVNHFDNNAWEKLSVRLTAIYEKNPQNQWLISLYTKIANKVQAYKAGNFSAIALAIAATAIGWFASRQQNTSA